MEFKTFKNHPLDLEPVQIGNQNTDLIQTSQVNEGISNSEIIICRDNYSMQVGDIIFDINLGDKDFKGEFLILEKWYYPYLKGAKRFFYPGENNPIGKCLFILADENGNKIPQGIHGFPEDIFQKGIKKGGGCIRYNKFDTEKIEELLKTGAKIKIV